MNSDFFKKIQQAASRLENLAHKTPVLTSSTLNQMLGAEVFFKCENLQRVGAFKFRGAYNCISQLSDEEKSRGVIAFSSGNHAQGVALVGKMLGIKTTIVMPDNAPKMKLEATKGYGADVILYNPETEVREQIADEIQSKHGYTLIPPFNHENIIAGQGTATLELMQELPEIDTLLTPCGGGGLLSGSAIAAKGMNPNCQVIGVEPEIADDAYQSFYSGKLVSKPNPPTIADGTRTSSLGDMTFDLIKKHVDAFVTISEQEIIEAVRFHLMRMKIVVEPSGALGLAALLANKTKNKGRIGVIISGGNIDSTTLRELLVQ